MPSSSGLWPITDPSGLLKPAQGHQRRSTARFSARLSALAAATLAALTCAHAPAGAQGQAEATQITITGTRIKSLAITSTSPVSQTSGEQIGLLRAASVEDFSSKLPQLAGGLTSSAAGAN
ncbi:MAG TPA: hypothetical protein VK439_00300, partial [Rubrivivax sp.]|nr:hypothetical protein [Rubrivivax sp.]